MKSKKVAVLSLLSLLCAVPSGRLLAEARGNTCEDAIAQKMKAEEHLKKISFLNNSRSTIPHGPMTHYAGKGFFSVPSGGKADFEWFCDITGATGKPENLYYEVSKSAAPAAKAEAPKEKEMPKEPERRKEKEEIPAVADGTPAQECRDAVTAEIKRKKPQASDLALSPPTESTAGKEGKLLEAEGSFKDDRGREVVFDYRCIYDSEKRKIVSSHFLTK